MNDHEVRMWNTVKVRKDGGVKVYKLFEAEYDEVVWYSWIGSEIFRGLPRVFVERVGVYFDMKANAEDVTAICDEGELVFCIGGEEKFRSPVRRFMAGFVGAKRVTRMEVNRYESVQMFLRLRRFPDLKDDVGIMGAVDFVVVPIPPTLPGREVFDEAEDTASSER